jgi:hypothetical protein
MAFNTTGKGSSAENFVARHLEEQGYTVGSLRHRKGGGDELAVHPDRPTKLVEVKGCKPGDLWQNFRRAQRQEMREVPLPPGSERILALVCGSGEKRTIEWFAESEWP